MPIFHPNHRSETTQILSEPEAKIDCKMDFYAMGAVKSTTLKYVELGAERSPVYAVCVEGQGRNLIELLKIFLRF